MTFTLFEICIDRGYFDITLFGIKDENSEVCTSLFHLYVYDCFEPSFDLFYFKGIKNLITTLKEEKE